jgi:N-ethylmaleimide reductase
MINSGFDKREVNKKICRSRYGKPYISNPDLVERFEHNLALAEADQDTFYSGGAKGYTDYPNASK